MHPQPKLHQKPCSEKLANMPATTDGRYCLKCKHSIRDLRDKSEAELLQMLKREGRLCGVIAPGQMPVSKQAAVPAEPSRWRSKLLALYAVLGAAVISPNYTQAQEVSTEQGVIDTNFPDQPSEEQAQLSESTIYIQGSVVEDETGEPLPFCNAFIEGTNIGSCSDFDGKFGFELDTSLVPDTITIRVTMLGFDTAKYTFTKEQYNYLPEFRLNPSYTDLVGFIIYPAKAPLHKRIWWRMRHPFPKKTHH